MQNDFWVSNIQNDDELSLFYLREGQKIKELKKYKYKNW